MKTHRKQKGFTRMDALVFGVMAPAVLAPAIVGMYSFGPVDLARATYNMVVGDNVTLKNRLGNYIVCEEQKQTGNDLDTVMETLGLELGEPLQNDRVTFRNTSTSDLFDAAERRSGFYDDFVWVRLDQYKNGSCGDGTSAIYDTSECMKNNPDCPMRRLE